MEQISHAYFYFFIFLLSAMLISIVTLKSVFFLARKITKPTPNNMTSDSYAGGFYLLSSVRQHFPLRFVFTALLFILFNAEFLLLLPWAVSLRISGWHGFAMALFFVLLWGIGYFYELKKGAFEWK